MPQSLALRPTTHQQNQKEKEIGASMKAKHIAIEIQNCINCHYYWSIENNSGQCRHNPPANTNEPTLRHPTISDARTDWCGKWYPEEQLRIDLKHHIYEA
jgi:hypothetical protein